MRIKIYTIILGAFMAVLVGGLAHTQVGMYGKYSVMSEDNRLKLVPLMAPRGGISDREGRDMVKDVLCFNVSVIYSRVRDVEVLAEALSSTLGIGKEQAVAAIKKSRMQPYVPVTVASDIGMEKAVRVEEAGMDHPGLLLEVSAKRKYLDGAGASGVLGYLGLINRPEFDRLRHYGYRMNDLVGRGGIEKYYDEYLRGTHGGKQVEVDHRGREAMILGFREPIPGKDIRLTIDLELQRFCDSLMEDKRGAIVAMNPYSGAVLAMSSAPGYDPEIFVDRMRNKEVAGILRDREYPLINRAVTGNYPPGSIFKVVVATAGMEEGVITSDTVFNCEGSISLGGRSFHCWRKSGHGDQTLAEAIKNSCNVYFWRTGLLLGVDHIAKYAEKFGIGERAGIDLPGETGGLLPTRDWKRKRFNEKWYKGETLNYSVGQGYVLCSPLQIVRVMSVFANRGDLVRPYVVESIEGVPVNVEDRRDLGLSPAVIAVVREGLMKCVNDKRGTGMKARLEDVVVAGKTGTAQTSQNKSHGWFAGFAPFDNARLTVVVFDEYGGKGGYYAAGTAGKVFEKAKELGLLDPV